MNMMGKKKRKGERRRKRGVFRVSLGDKWRRSQLHLGRCSDDSCILYYCHRLFLPSPFLVLDARTCMNVNSIMGIVVIVKK